ncbi:hypothetical protein ACMSI6_10605 [Pseudomonas antarctica]
MSAADTETVVNAALPGVGLAYCLHQALKNGRLMDMIRLKTIGSQLMG